jgi:hypothetical protein
MCTYFFRTLTTGYKSSVDFESCNSICNVTEKPFHFMHCWTRLKNEPKWDAMVHGSPWRGNAGTEPVRSLTPTGSVNDVEYDEGGSKGKRPLGRDSTKASRKKAMSSSSQSTDYLSRLHDIQIARLKQSEEKSELK